MKRLAAYGEPVEGTPFGRYRLIELLGEGGMGEVWRAHDTVTDRVVAIKVLPAKLSKDEEFQRRFRREAHAAARLETPHVVPIHDYGEIDGRLFVCMRLIKGRDLAAVLADGPLKPARAVRIIGQVAEALHAAHEIGLIHRDIKPSNILLDDRDFAYLIDFGIARDADDTRLTKTGNTIGTFAYIAPERLDPKGEEDARVDIYSLACVLYECLTGEPPFAADTMPRLIVAHMNSPPPRPSITRPEVPAQVDKVIATGMAKDPDQRYATTIELADAARDAITAPIKRQTPRSARLPATEPAPGPTLLADPTRPGPGPALHDGQPPPVSGPTSARTKIWAAVAVVAALVVLAVALTNQKHIARLVAPETSVTAQPTVTTQPTVGTQVAAPPPPPADMYAAIAVSVEGYWGTSIGSNMDEAKASAMARCQGTPGHNCRLAAWTANGCVAVARNDAQNYQYGGVGSSVREAEQDALARTNGGRILVSFCTS